MRNEFNGLHGKARIENMAMLFADTAGPQIPTTGKEYARALYSAAKSKNASLDEALFVLAAITAYWTKSGAPKTHRKAVDVLESIFENVACVHLCYDEYMHLAAMVVKLVRGVDICEVLNLFNSFKGIRCIEDLCD